MRIKETTKKKKPKYNPARKYIGTGTELEFVGNIKNIEVKKSK